MLAVSSPSAVLAVDGGGCAHEMIDIHTRIFRPASSSPKIIRILDEPVAGDDHRMNAEHLGNDVAVEQTLAVLAKRYEMGGGVGVQKCFIFIQAKQG